MNSRATNITKFSYLHVCTTAITVQMGVNFIIDLENNVRTKHFRADRIFRNYQSGRTKIFNENFGPGPNISGPKFQWQDPYIIETLLHYGIGTPGDLFMFYGGE